MKKQRAQLNILIIIAVINLVLISESIAATQLFSDNFESGSLSKWTTITSGVALASGGRGNSNCAKIDYSLASLQVLSINLGSRAPNNEFYVSFWVKIPTTYNAPYLGYKWMRLKHGNVDGIQSEFFLNSESWVSSGHTYQTGQGGLSYPNTNWSWYSNGHWNNNAWHHVEVYGKYNTNSQANGVCRIWFDGTQYLNNTSYTWRTGTYANDIFKIFYLPSNAGDGVHRPASGDIVYVDDVEIWDGMPSKDSTAPPAPVGVKISIIP
jgi:hypothetical protein